MYARSEIANLFEQYKNISTAQKEKNREISKKIVVKITTMKKTYKIDIFTTKLGKSSSLLETPTSGRRFSYMSKITNVNKCLNKILKLFD